MNEVLKAMKERRSIRQFRPDMVSREDLDTIIEAGLYAASGMGNQATVIVAVTNRELRDRLSAVNAKLMGQGEAFDPFYGAPAVLIVLGNKKYPTFQYDGSLTMGNMMLAAHALGLGSCWIHRAKEEFETDEFKSVLSELGLEGDFEGIGHCIVGYPAAEAPEAAPRKQGRVFYAE